MEEGKPNVSSIGDARKKKKKDPAEIPLKTAEVYKALSDVLRRQPFVALPPFPVRYEVLEPERGVRLPLLVAADESVTIARKDALATDILTYVDLVLGGRPDFALKAQQAREAADYYLMTATPVAPEALKTVRWANEPGLTYRRLPWSFEHGPAPTWETLLSRMSNVQAFIDWVGSLFIEESSLQNYVWIYGTGGDGKGSINRFLAKALGSSYRSKQPPSAGRYPDKFWTYGLMGARLVTFPDCNDHAFVAGGLFKSLTGGDPVDVEAKGQMSFTATLKAKYLVLSQEKPSISSERADLRRIIYCALGTCAEYDPHFEDKLWIEGGYFLSIAIQQYLDKYPQHGPIVTCTEEVEAHVSTLEEPFEVTFNEYFLLNQEASVTPIYMQGVLTSEFRVRTHQLEFLKWLERKYLVRKKRFRDKDERSWGYAGIELKKVPPL